MKDKDLLRFFAKIKFVDDCWVWTAGRTKGEYGKFKLNGKTIVAHKVLYEFIFGKVREGLQLDHLCRNPPCVNPTHLDPVTSRVNLLRGKTAAAKGAFSTHCKHGHEFTLENTYVRKNGTRQCKRCQADRSLARYYEKKANV